MLIPLDRLKSLYDRIINNALGTEGQGTSIYIFTTNETDSLCALKMLTSLLKSDEMQYNSIPVFSNLNLLEELKKLQSSPHVRSLIFLNCGGLLDLTSLWYYTPESPVECFIFDSHRPFHHNNIIDVSRKVYIIHDGCESFDKYPTHEDFQFLQEMQDDEDEEDDEVYDEDDSEKEEANYLFQKKETSVHLVNS